MKSSLLFCFLLPFTSIGQYRISQTHELVTAPETKAAHASTVLDLGKNRLLSAWFGGEYEGHPNVGIYLARFNGQAWEPGKEVARAETMDGKTYPCWNPVLVKNSSNTIFLYYKVGPNPREWWGQVMTSEDEGKTWSEPERLPGEFLGPIRVKPLMLANGEFLYPSSTETPDTDHWSAHFELSDKEGNHWQKIPMDCDTFQIIQPTLLDFSEGKLLMLARSRHNRVIGAYSYNYGNSWTSPFPINLPNPNSGIDAVKAGRNTFLMVYNPLEAGKDWWEGRSRLVLGSSTDGLNWKEILTLEAHEKGEYSYPAIIRSADGKIHITYTYDRKYIKHLILEK